MNKVELLERLRQLFSEGEIRDICFELDIDYESLSGSGKGGKSRELINYLSRRERLNDLINNLLTPGIYLYNRYHLAQGSFLVKLVAI